MPRQNWTRSQLLAAFNLYCRTPFGRLHTGNPDVIALAQHIDRTPNAVAMKLVNFASLDPVQQARGIKGLSNVAQADRELFAEFSLAPEQIAIESEEAFETYFPASGKSPSLIDASEETLTLPQGETEVARVVRVRRVQGFFRRVVLSSYNHQCAVCGLHLTELLTASHIIPWSRDVERRADPHNGLSLCSLHDRAFDQGLIAFDNSNALLLASKVHSIAENPVGQAALLAFSGHQLITPTRFAPDPIALTYHREHIFQG